MKNFKKTVMIMISLANIPNIINGDPVNLTENIVTVLQEQSFLDQWKTLEADDISQILPTQIKSISSSIIPYITNDQIIQLTIPQIQALTSNQIQALTPGQISALTINQIATFTEEQIQSFTKKQIYGLTTNQLALLFNLLSEKQITYLNTNQIQTLSINQLSSMTLEQLKAFTVDQITDFTPYQLSQIMILSTTMPNSSILSNMTAMQISGISVAQINGMSGNQRTEFFNILSNQTNTQNPNKQMQIEAIAQGSIATGPEIKIKNKSNEPEYKTAGAEKAHAPGTKSLYEVNKASGLAKVNEQSEKDLNTIGRKLSGKKKKKKKKKKK